MRIGTNGFEALCSIDPGFEEFERVLFSDTSLNFERSIQTKEVNDSLNVTIQRFLIRLSPYFLLSPAHKALEWLVHRSVSVPYPSTIVPMNSSA